MEIVVGAAFGAVTLVMMAGAMLFSVPDFARYLRIRNM